MDTKTLWNAKVKVIGVEFEKQKTAPFGAVLQGYQSNSLVLDKSLQGISNCLDSLSDSRA